MYYKNFLLFLFIFLFSCENKSSKINYSKNFDFYSNKGFALVYNDDLFKNKVVNKKINNRSLIIFNNKLDIDTPVKITNLLNGKDLIAKVGKNSLYPEFYNSVISNRIAKELFIDLTEPYIKIQTLNSNSTFIANKAKTYKEEKKVANKAPVDNINIVNIGEIKKNPKISIKKKRQNFNYIIKFADLYFEDSAILLKERLLNEFNIGNLLIKKLSNNSFRVYKGPYKNLESIKKAFDEIDDIDFENIEIIKL